MSRLFYLLLCLTHPKSSSLYLLETMCSVVQLYSVMSLSFSTLNWCVSRCCCCCHLHCHIHSNSAHAIVFSAKTKSCTSLDPILIQINYLYVILRLIFNMHRKWLCNKMYIISLQMKFGSPSSIYRVYFSWSVLALVLPLPFLVLLTLTLIWAVLFRLGPPASL